MTAYRFVTLTCDGCGEIFDSGNSKTVRDARRQAQAKGWRYWQREDLCPRHFGHYYSDVAGWVYHPAIAYECAVKAGYVYYGPNK